MISGYEGLREPLATRARFLHRLLHHGAVAATILAASLALGIAGYHWIAGESWIDSFLNACMLLGGMGPVGDLATNAGKLFAGCYALYCGIVFIAVSGILLAPVLHRVMHRLHLDDPH
ncbi:MAG: hypothetical protein ABI960_05540 [Candidatus Eisenbacteria bacterium]